MRRKSIAKYINPWMWKRDKDRERFAMVRARDGDDCWRCGHRMVFDGPKNAGRAATIEHVLPKSHGGTSALENLRLCHVGCNRFLGANSPEQKERMRNNRARLQR